MKNIAFKSDPGEARTLDPMIKSHLLYQLSYGVKIGMQRYNKFRFPSTSSPFFRMKKHYVETHQFGMNEENLKKTLFFDA